MQIQKFFLLFYSEFHSYDYNVIQSHRHVASNVPIEICTSNMLPCSRVVLTKSPRSTKNYPLKNIEHLSLHSALTATGLCSLPFSFLSVGDVSRRFPFYTCQSTDIDCRNSMDSGFSCWRHCFCPCFCANCWHLPSCHYFYCSCWSTLFGRRRLYDWSPHLLLAYEVLTSWWLASFIGLQWNCNTKTLLRRLFICHGSQTLREISCWGSGWKTRLSNEKALGQDSLPLFIGPICRSVGPVQMSSYKIFSSARSIQVLNHMIAMILLKITLIIIIFLIIVRTHQYCYQYNGK